MSYNEKTKGRRTRGIKNATAKVTPYIKNVVFSNNASIYLNILAAVCCWLTLSGFVVLPSTFTSIEANNTLEKSEAGKALQHAVQNIHVLRTAACMCGIGTLGICCLWYINWKQFTWLKERLFW